MYRSQIGNSGFEKQGRGGLVEKVSSSGPEGFRFETRCHGRSAVYVGLMHVKSDVMGQASSRLCGAEVWRGGQLKCRPRHLTVQNYEVRSKMSRGR
ncbi:hypothetical protein AVEN_203410-1 [Araneus ventricosus]|uniref:Uncharacterized protein n=1 Tax=Araneus ventricosus TaxID=182803 RepID=A0A4Y2I9N2_ARAVE|nr:hypothetical protein AVEN_203410-1 [Araneus ventricosus]